MSTLLPVDEDARWIFAKDSSEDMRVDVEAFQSHLRRTHEAGLVNAVNMDTGYINYLSEQERLSVLQWTHEALGPDARFVAGAYIEDADGEMVSLTGAR